MARALGLDVGTHACKVAVVDGGARGARLVRFAEVPYELGGAGVPTKETILAGVRKALSDAKGPRHAASHALPAEQCILREISVPFEQDEQIRKTVRFEFEPHLHSGAIEDVVLDFLKTGPARSGTRLLVIAATKDTIRDRLSFLQQAGVDPLHLDVDVASLFNVAKEAGVFEEHPNCLIIDIGARTTKAVSVRGGQLRVARSIRLGARGAQREVERQLEGDADAATRAIEDSSRTAALAEPPRAGTVEIVNSVREIEAEVARAVQDDFLSRVLRETQRSLPATGSDQPMTRVFLTGGGSRHPRARERIAEHFGVEVVDLPVLSALTHDLPPSEAANVAASGAVAVGTALKVLGIDHGGLDLRKDEFRYSRVFDRVKVALAAGVTILFFGVFLFWLTSLLRLKSLEREAADLRKLMDAELRAEVFDAYEEAVPEPRKAPEISGAVEPKVAFQRTREHVQGIRNHLKNELGLATEVPPIRSCLETWAATMRAVTALRAVHPAQPKVEYLLVKEEKFYQDRGELTVILGEQAQGDLVLDGLRKEPIFEKAEARPPRRTKDERWEIPILLKIVEKSVEEGAPGAAAPSTAPPAVPPDEAKPAGAGDAKEDGR